MDTKTRVGLRDDVRMLHDGGMPPSEIDVALGLDDGTAHDVMVAIWAKEKEDHARYGKGARW